MTVRRPGLLVASVVAVVAAIVVAVGVPGNAEFVQQGADQGLTYGYLPTLVLHHDLDFSRDAIPFDSSMPHTATGRSQDVFPMGASFWWAPGFVAAHAVTSVLGRVRDAGPADDGRSRAYDILVGWAAIAVMVVGLWAVYLIVRRFAGVVPSVLATAGIWLAGPLVYYGSQAPLQSHVAGFATSALLILAWLRLRDREDGTLGSIALLGILGGFVALCRWQDGLILLGPAIDAASGRLRRRRWVDLPGAAVFAAGIVFGFLPQLAVWNGLFGSPFRPPGGGASGGFVNLSRLHVGGVLFSWWHGMFSWHPLLAVAVIGLAFGLRRHRLVCGCLLVSLAAMAVVNAGAVDWWGGAAFGGRRFDGLWPGLAIGLGIVFDRLSLRSAALITAVAVAWNWLLLCAFVQSTIPNDAPVTPTGVGRAIRQTSLLPHITSWSIDKVFWVAGLAALALVPLLAGWRRGAHRARAVRVPPLVTAVAIAAISILLSGAVVVAAHDHPGPYDPHVFEAAYFVPQPTRPTVTDRIVAPGEEVWTVIWSFPGFLLPGRYVPEAVGLNSVGAPARLIVSVDGARVLDVAAGSGSTAASGPTAGPAFRIERGFHRLDIRAEGAALHLGALRIEPAK